MGSEDGGQGVMEEKFVMRQASWHKASDAQEDLNLKVADIMEASRIHPTSP